MGGTVKSTGVLETNTQKALYSNRADILVELFTFKCFSIHLSTQVSTQYFFSVLLLVLIRLSFEAPL